MEALYIEKANRASQSHENQLEEQKTKSDQRYSMLEHEKAELENMLDEEKTKSLGKKKVFELKLEENMQEKEQMMVKCIFDVQK